LFTIVIIGDSGNRLHSDKNNIAGAGRPKLTCISMAGKDATDAIFKAAKRAANELSNPEEVQRIIRQKEQARDAEQRLDEALE